MGWVRGWGCDSEVWLEVWPLHQFTKARATSAQLALTGFGAWDRARLQKSTQLQSWDEHAAHTGTMLWASTCEAAFCSTHEILRRVQWDTKRRGQTLFGGEGYEAAAPAPQVPAPNSKLRPGHWKCWPSWSSCVFNLLWWGKQLCLQIAGLHAFELLRSNGSSKGSRRKCFC